jgi:ATP/maltotriose-dependent transcriptional regulator MalT
MAEDPDIARGRAALDAWAWDDAKRAFEAALDREESPEALEGLSTAAAWLDDVALALSSRERAYRLHRRNGDDPSAAATALAIGQLVIDFKGEPVVARGWIDRARALLRGHPDSLTLAVADGQESYIALAYEKDVPRARTLVERAGVALAAAGHQTGEIHANAMRGLVLVTEGNLDEGMRALDESAAAAVGGDLDDFESVVGVCCLLVTACLRVRDVSRAAQWSREVMSMAPDRAKRNRGVMLYPRTEYATAQIYFGEWAAAERQLLGVVADAQARPVAASLALLRLADLRVRQGRLDEADALLDELSRPPYRSPIGDLPVVVRAASALAREDWDRAAVLASRYLASIPTDDFVGRIDALDVLAHGAAATGDRDRAKAAAEELGSIAEALPTVPIRATWRAAVGSAAWSRSDAPAAATAFGEAARGFEQSEMPYEAAGARLQVARALVAGGDLNGARFEAARARATFGTLGAAAEERRARRLEDGIGPTRIGREGAERPLSARELEILSLLARGASNEDMALQLTLSIRTVERHVSNVYAKIGAEGSAARALATAYAHAHGIA